MTMNGVCFVEQIGNAELFERVGHYCAECYREFAEGEPIYYDMQEFRYLCRECADRLSQRMNERCEVVEEERAATLF
ncbi:hypothetical protein [Nitratifractor sp.]